MCSRKLVSVPSRDYDLIIIVIVHLSHNFDTNRIITMSIWTNTSPRKGKASSVSAESKVDSLDNSGLLETESCDTSWSSLVENLLSYNFNRLWSSPIVPFMPLSVSCCHYRECLFRLDFIWYPVFYWQLNFLGTLSLIRFQIVCLSDRSWKCLS